MPQSLNQVNLWCSQCRHSNHGLQITDRIRTHLQSGILVQFTLRALHTGSCQKSPHHHTGPHPPPAPILPTTIIRSSLQSPTCPGSIYRLKHRTWFFFFYSYFTCLFVIIRTISALIRDHNWPKLMTNLQTKPSVLWGNLTLEKYIQNSTHINDQKHLLLALEY